MAVITASRMDTQRFARWNGEVSGWFSSPHELEERPGIYVVATQDSQLPFILDVGESENVRFCVLNHERRVLWRRNALGGLLYASIYTGSESSPFLRAFERSNLAQHIRNLEQPIFGEDDLFRRAV